MWQNVIIHKYSVVAVLRPYSTKRRKREKIYKNITLEFKQELEYFRKALKKYLPVNRDNISVYILRFPLHIFVNQSLVSYILHVLHDLHKLPFTCVIEMPKALTKKIGNELYFYKCLSMH